MDVWRYSDIVIIPVRLSLEENRVKSSNRAVQAFALGKPVIASPLPAYLEVIVDGFNGYIYADEEELKKILLDLTRERVSDMQKNALQSLNSYKLEKIIDLWIKVLGLDDGFVGIAQKKQYFQGFFMYVFLCFIKGRFLLN